MHPFGFPGSSALVAFDHSGSVAGGGLRWLFVDVVGWSGRFVASLPSHGVGVCDSHDLNLHAVVWLAVSAEVVLCFRGFGVGSNLLLNDGCSDGVVGVLVSLDKSVYGRLVPVNS